MKIHTPHSKAKGVAQAWKKQYSNAWKKDYDNEKIDIYNKLKALGANPDPATIGAIVGNCSWTICVCDECTEESGATAEFKFGESSIALCLTCVIKAASRNVCFNEAC